MELSAEQKAQLEAPLKAALKSVVDLLEVAALMAVQASPTKLDDAIIPLVEPLAKAKLIEVIEGLKL